ncbi:hypothetical protein [Shewanella benthica]
MRSKIIADEIRVRWPNAKIDFVLNRYVSYIDDCPYATHLVDDTPTKKTREVNQLITELKPDVVIFDAAGRKAQLKHAHRMGAKVIFISQHRRKRSRGMKIARARVTDSHWVVQPEFVIGPINWLDKLKLSLIKKSEPIVIGPIFTHPSEAKQSELLQKYGVEKNEYLIFNAGSGGHKKGGVYAADVFARVAKAIYQATKLTCLMVYGSNYPKQLQVYEGVVGIEQINHADFINLLVTSRAAVLSGGDTLMQAIALKKAALAVAVSKDQAYRLNVCKANNFIVSSPFREEDMLAGVLELLTPETMVSLQASLKECQCSNGLHIGIREIGLLFKQDIVGI